MIDPLQPQFAEVLTLIKTAQQKVIATANQELIKLYWSVGKYISDRLAISDFDVQFRKVIGDREVKKLIGDLISTESNAYIHGTA